MTERDASTTPHTRPGFRLVRAYPFVLGSSLTGGGFNLEEFILALVRVTTRAETAHQELCVVMSTARNPEDSVGPCA